MPTVNRVTEINAPASTVWKILADTPAYPQWNPFMTRFDGPFQRGAKLTVTIEPPGSKPQTFKPTVTEVESGRRVSWLGRLLMPGIFDGAHHLTVDPSPPREAGSLRARPSPAYSFPSFAASSRTPTPASPP